MLLNLSLIKSFDSSLETAMSQLIIFFNAIYSTSQASVHAQRKKTNTPQRERYTGKTEFYKLFYLEKSCISLEIFHFNLAVMPGENCAFVGYSSNRLLKLPTGKDETTKKWRRKMLNVITKGRVVDPIFKKQREKDHVYVCKKHFRECDMYICK